MVLATRWVPGARLGHWGGLVVWTMVGGTLAAGSANAINCYLDRDIDLLMARTRRRPLPAHEVEPERAVVFGIVLGIISFALMAWTVNLLAAFLTLLAIAFYVVVYTMLLKRTTPQNIVIGGAAGALPPVIGWAAVTGDVGIPALILFALVFYWTPPHFWALSLRIRKDYAAAGVPMLPVVRGIPETTRQIGLYTILMVAISLVLWPVAQMGLIYLGAAVGLGAVFIWQACGAVAAGRVGGGLDGRRHRPLSLLDQLPLAPVPGHRRRRSRPDRLMAIQGDRYEAFRTLHEAGCFVIPNPWDIGSARLLEGMGFKALATTSAGFAWSVGRPDNGVTVDQALDHLRLIASSVAIPVNADFENGFAIDPDRVADHVAQATETGIAGLSIEDSSGDPADPLFPFDLSVERIRAARSAIDDRGGRVLLTARSEGYVVGRPDLDDTIRRLQAYAEAGADCLYAPRLPGVDEIATVLRAVAPKPVNVLVGSGFTTVTELADLGVRRISVGGGLARVAWQGFLEAARQIARDGTFGGLDGGVPFAEIDGAFADRDAG